MLIASLAASVATTKPSSSALSLAVSASSKLGLRMTMTILPIIGLMIAVFIFGKKYILTDEKLEEISEKLRKTRA